MSAPMAGVTHPEVIELTPPVHDPLAKWQPRLGAETTALLARLALAPASTQILKDESLRILSRTVPPTSTSGEETGLVIGYVQSGKTMSFTTVAALARDNGYRLVIVITGTSKPLFEQSTARLLRDLEILTRQDRKWKHFPNPSAQGAARTSIQDTLAEWTDLTVPETERQTVLITVMKSHTHLRKLNSLLGQLTLDGVPALVIDDEADQAGLNTLVNRQDQSTTYRHLLTLKQRLPHHSFLQYTATPQAPLLINLIDVLSPSFAEVLTPGPGYVGGKELFVERRALVRTIPAAEIPGRGNTLNGPPESLLFAMRLFFLGVAAGIVTDGSCGNRSMLIHPSQETLRHSEYFQWVRNAKTHWQTTLELPESDPDRREIIADFASAYRDLAATEPGIPSIDMLIARLPHALRRTREEEVNAARGKTPAIPWHDTYAHILVGGQAMDRGFTVEGLTVTYMPRLLGGGNADTVQQRARFFGYKRPYIGYCRIFLEQDAAEAYRQYVTHEEDIRGQMLGLRERGLTLRDWKRDFLLTRSLKPTRDSVLDLPYMRFTFGSEWYYPKAPHDSAEITRANRDVVLAFEQSLNPTPDTGSARRTAMQQHLVKRGIPLATVIAQLLSQYKITLPTEAPRYTSLLLQLQQFSEDHSQATCTVYVMNRGVDAHASRKRVVNGLNELTSYLFQGEHPQSGRAEPKGSIYPGDRNLPSDDTFQVQIHHLRLERADSVVEDDVPTIAIHGPLMDDVVSQAQGGLRQ